MMIPIVGTIRNTVNVAVMDNKWQQRKNNIGKEKEPMTAMDYQIKAFKEDLRRMRESEKIGAIDAKLKSGMGLSPDEIEYLQKKYPEKYKEYLEIKQEKESYERQLKSCKTKEDVERFRFTKMNGYLAEAKSVSNNPNIPKGKKLELLEKILKKVMGVQDVHMDFVKSAWYKNLPTDEERTEEIKEKYGNAEEEENNEKIDDDSPDTEKVKEETESPENEVTEDISDGNEPEKIFRDTPKETHKPITLPELSVKADNKFKEAKDILTTHLAFHTAAAPKMKKR